MPNAPRYRRILLKVSGEALMGSQGYGIDPAVVSRIVGDIAGIVQSGVEVAVVVGGGNIFRGVQVAAKGGDRVTGDHMGMLATVMNGLALRDAFGREGIAARVVSGVAMPTVCEPFVQARALRHLEKGRVVIFVGGTGNPFFTTDTASALRAAEMGCDALLKATQVDGIYSADPKKDPNATRFDRLTHQEVLNRGLEVMDAAAIALARDNRIPIIVFSIHEPGSLAAVVAGTGRATVVEG
ncbi:MAG: UMP kinase [Hyphomicrobiales bacterium]